MNNGRIMQDQAAQDRAALYGQLQGVRERVEVKDPTVHNAQDAVAAITRRREKALTELAEMKARIPQVEAEIARIDRMLAAAEEP